MDRRDADILDALVSKLITELDQIVHGLVLDDPIDRYRAVVSV